MSAPDPRILNLVTPPPSGEAPIPFERLVEAARAALPADMPTDPSKILVGLDLDGTVLLPTGASERVRSAIRAAGDAGMHAVIATGRSLEATAPVLGQLGDPSGWALCSNGAVTAHFDPASPEGAEVCELRFFDPDGLIGLVAEHLPDAIFGVEVPGMFLVSGWFPPGELIEAHEVVPLDDLRGRRAIKVVVRAPHMSRPDFDSLLTAIGVPERWECSVGWTSWADVLPLGVSKASGLESLAERLGVPPSGTVAIGDGTNDVPMIRWANFGVVMGGASADIKAEGDHVTGAVENDGAAAVIRAVLEHCGVVER